MPSKPAERRIYDEREHRVEKERQRPIVEAGHALCTEPICIMPTRWIKPGTPWDAAHDRVNGGYHGPAHAQCNRAEGGRYARAKAKRRANRSRNW